MTSSGTPRGRKNGASTSRARSKKPTSKIWLPMWQWTPARRDGRPGAVEAGHRLCGGARAHAETELGVVVTGAHVLVGMGLDARRHPDEDGRLPAVADLRHQALEAVDLVEGVDDDAPCFCDKGLTQLPVGLVVSVQDQALPGHAGGQGHIGLPPGRHVDAEPSSCASRAISRQKNALDAYATPSPKAANASRQRLPKVLFVVDEHRCPHVPAQGDDVDAADQQTPPGSRRRGQRKQAPGQGRRVRRGGVACGHIVSGAVTPSSPRPTAKPTRVASTSHKRAWVDGRGERRDG